MTTPTDQPHISAEPSGREDFMVSGNGGEASARTEVGPLAHTPGPWRVVLYDAGDIDHRSGMPSVVSDHFDCGIVHGEGFAQRFWRSARGDAEIHANARLIAAAPDMYEALVALMAASSEEEEFFAFQRARAAIAKAVQS